MFKVEDLIDFIEGLRLAGYKLPIPTKVIARHMPIPVTEEAEGEAEHT